MKWMNSTLIVVAVGLLAACGSQDTGPRSVADGRDDAFDVAEGSDQAKSVLALVNRASFAELDVDAALDVRAARNIIAYRSGEDGQASTADDETFDTLVELDEVPWVGPRAFGKLLDYAQAVDEPAGPDTVHGIEENSPEAKGVLEVANTLDQQTLDDEVALDARAARNIVAYRAGQDETPGTSDDRTFATLTELDAISWVSERAFGRLLDYARANDFIVDDPDGPREGESTDPFDDSFCLGDPIAFEQAAGHFDPGMNTTTLGTAKWSRRQRTCNSLTGCSGWTSIDVGYIDAKVGLKTNDGDVIMTLDDTPVSHENQVYCNTAYPVTGTSQIQCTGYHSSYPYVSKTFKGKMTDHCVRLVRDEKTNTDHTSSWTETQYVLTQRFAPVNDRSFGGPNDPEADAASDSPFNAASCAGPAITQEEAVSHFDPGANTTSLGQGEWSFRERSCNEISGCEDWRDVQIGYITATAGMKVNDGDLIMTLDDTPVSHENQVYCNTAYPVTGTRQIQCTGYHSSYPYVSKTFKGRMTNSCVRLHRIESTSKDSTSSWVQKQYVFSKTF